MVTNIVCSVSTALQCCIGKYILMVIIILLYYFVDGFPQRTQVGTNYYTTLDIILL